MKFIDLNGKIVGDWTILGRAPSKAGRTYWHVQCKCGVEKVRSSQNIRSSHSCHKCAMNRLSKHMEIGDSYGQWTVIAQAESKNGKRWVCRCQCGANRIIPARTLRSDTSTCCFQCGRAKLRKFVGAMPKWLVTQTKRSAAERNLAFRLTIDYLNEIFENQSGICALTGIKLDFSTSPKRSTKTTASIDRIDNAKGYVKDNVRFVHKTVNIMRKDMCDEELIKWCRYIVEYTDRKGVKYTVKD